MTAEGSQSAPVNPEGSQSAPVQGQTTGNQQLRIAILVVVAALVGVGLWLAFGNSSNKHNKHKQGSLTTAIGPKTMSKRELSNEAIVVNQPVYWAGPKKGYHYEFWRLKNGRIFVRYLPVGTKAGAPGKKYLIIGTYWAPGAYNAFKKTHNYENGPRGSVIWTDRKSPNSVYVAWPGRNYEIEVYHPKASKAAAIAADGSVSPVG